MNKHTPQIEADEIEQPTYQPGELDGSGVCRDCGLNYSANVGVYFCFACSDEE